MKLAILQIRTEIDQDETLAKAERMVNEAAANGAEIVVLPEMFNCPYARKYFRPYARLGHEKTVSLMSRWAKENKLLLVGGSVPETEGDKIYNTCFVFNENGDRIARHRKVHLFDIDIPGMRFSESATFTRGDEITVFDTKWGRMGAAVCFDVRFAEMFRAMAMRGAKLIFLPAQFNTTTGPLHWDMLLRTRANDNQVFLAAAAAARYEGFDYECWGHSTVVDPMGLIRAQCDETEQILYSDIDLAEVDEARERLPVFEHLREDIYEVAK